MSKFDKCVHSDACVRTARRLSPMYDAPETALRCDECKEYESDPCSICPMRLSGTMRCEGQR